MRAKKLSKRKAPSQDRSKATVDAITRAAARILSREGYDAASTNRIAAEAGVSVGSLYQYFPNKESIVAALIEAHAEETFEVFRSELGRVASTDLESAARAVVTAQVAAHTIDPKLHRVFFEQLPKVGMLDRLHEVHRRSESLVQVYLEARRDELRASDPRLAAFILVTAVEAITHAAAGRHDQLNHQDFINEVTALCVRYLRRDGSDR